VSSTPYSRAVVLALAVSVATCGRGDGPSLQGAGRTIFSAATTAGASDSLVAAAEAVYADEQWDSARTIWNVVLARARAAGDERTAARVLTRIGNAAWRLGDLAAARARSEEALAIKLRLGMADELSRSYNALGLIAYSDGRNEDAVRMYQRAIETARAVGDTEGVAKASGNMALPALDLGDFRSARDGSRMLREAGRALDSARLEANGLANEAMVDIWTGDPRPAIARLDTARRLYRRIGYATGEENALRQLATAFELTGDHDRAFAALDTALRIARRRGLREQEAEDLRLIAGLHAGLGDHRRALRHFEQAERLARAVGLDADRGNILRGAAAAHLRLGNLRRARASAEEALRLHRATGEPQEQLEDLLLVVEIDVRAGERASAASRLDTARTLAGRIDTRGTRIAVALAEARSADVGQNASRVLEALRAARNDMVPDDFGAVWQSNALAARAYMRTGALDSAAAAGRRAITAIERLRGVLASQALRATYVADRADVYGDLVVVLLRLGRPEDAFAVADGARSRDLLEHLSAARHAASAQLPRELLEADDLLRQIDALVRRLRETRSARPPRERGESADTVGATLAARLAKARSDYEALIIRAAQRNPRATALLGTHEPRTDEVRTSLGPDERIVEYLITPDKLVVFVVGRGGLEVVETDLTVDALTQRVRLLRDLWGSPRSDWTLGLPAARALDRTLIAPLRRAGVLRGARRLLIVPHGILGQVPFAALQDEQSRRFLVQDYAIAHLPSAAAIPLLRRRPAPVRVSLTAGEGFAPLPEALPASRAEVDALRASLPGATVRLGVRADEPALRRALATQGIVHVASHGVLNARNPMFSRVELARRRSSAPASHNDGRLEAHEIVGLSIASPLVFLSGCETGAGQAWTDDAVRGTADLTLAQALLAAGAANVISTLWRIDDAGAAVFAGHFYRSLGRTQAVEALAAAQRTMLGSGRHASPYYWASYTLSGDGRLRGGPQNGSAASVP
jgi:CHAT domain-containing protein